jgi:hypothetical protein
LKQRTDLGRCGTNFHCESRVQGQNVQVEKRSRYSNFTPLWTPLCESSPYRLVSGVCRPSCEAGCSRLFSIFGVNRSPTAAVGGSFRQPLTVEHENGW